MRTRSSAPRSLVLPMVEIQPLVPPEAVAHLRDGVRGWWKRLRARVAGGKATRSVGTLGPLLLVGWLAIAAAFIYAVS
jgi:hypothetical protein